MPKYAVYEKQSRVVVHEVEAEDEYEARRCVSNEVSEWDEFSYMDEPFSGEFINVVQLSEEQDGKN